jgi:DNA-binding MarR family transcriptional regulator
MKDTPHTPPVHRFYDGDHYVISDSIGYLTRQIASFSSAIVDARMAEHGLTDAQWKPLLMIRNGQCRTAAEVARQACSDTGAVTRLLDRVEAKGLVRRNRSQEDRRVVNLELTDEGTAVAQVVPHVLADALNEMLAGFSLEEADTLKTLLQRLHANAQRMYDALD